MDVDTPSLLADDVQGIDTIAKVEGKKPMSVPVDDAHPFDLEAYISQYSSTNTIVFLTFH